MPENNPLRQLHAAIWTMLEASNDFTDLVLAGNRIKFSGTVITSPDKDVLGTSDVPQVRVVPTGLRPRLDAYSNGSLLNVNWEIQVVSGDQLLKTVLDVEWAVFRAMLGWYTHVKTLTWNGNQFVNYAGPLETRMALDYEELSRGVKGWAAIWRAETRMHFNTTDLTP